MINVITQEENICYIIITFIMRTRLELNLKLTTNLTYRLPSFIQQEWVCLESFGNAIKKQFILKKTKLKWAECSAPNKVRWNELKSPNWKKYFLQKSLVITVGPAFKILYHQTDMSLPAAGYRYFRMWSQGMLNHQIDKRLQHLDAISSVSDR